MAALDRCTNSNSRPMYFTCWPMEVVCSVGIFAARIEHTARASRFRVGSEKVIKESMTSCMQCIRSKGISWRIRSEQRKVRVKRRVSTSTGKDVHLREDVEAGGADEDDIHRGEVRGEEVEDEADDGGALGEHLLRVEVEAGLIEVKKRFLYKDGAVPVATQRLENVVDVAVSYQGNRLCAGFHQIQQVVVVEIGFKEAQKSKRRHLGLIGITRTGTLSRHHQLLHLVIVNSITSSSTSLGKVAKAVSSLLSEFCEVSKYERLSLMSSRSRLVSPSSRCSSRQLPEVLCARRTFSRDTSPRFEAIGPSRVTFVEEMFNETRCGRSSATTSRADGGGVEVRHRERGQLVVAGEHRQAGGGQLARLLDLHPPEVVDRAAKDCELQGAIRQRIPALVLVEDVLDEVGGHAKEQLIIEVTAHFDVVAEAVQPVHYLAEAEGVQRFGRFGGVHCL
ncbi:hypothetical protein TYRP_001510 [Tyrophagus putrescentiae]|nr:hypothetical protein TYRP_001510 [Tyrophagus putrescentiae]